MTETRIDVRVEQVDSAPAGKKHPNTCPQCGSHFRDDELAAALMPVESPGPAPQATR